MVFLWFSYGLPEGNHHQSTVSPSPGRLEAGHLQQFAIQDHLAALPRGGGHIKGLTSRRTTRSGGIHRQENDEIYIGI